MLHPAAMDRLPVTAASGVTRRPIGGLATARVRYGAAVVLLFPPLAEFVPRVDGSVLRLLALLLLSVGAGLALGLVVSRRHAVAAAHEERRRVVRDLHDGAQQRLVHTIIVLKLARRALDADGGSGRALAGEALEEAEAALRELRRLASGVSPSVLSRGGLAAGLRELAEHTPVPVAVDVSVGRLPFAVETAAYFVVAEALTNVAKHARARTASVAAWLDAGVLHAEVRDDGAGGADLRGSGLAGLQQRVAELGGRLEVASGGEGTRVTAAIPLVR